MVYSVRFVVSNRVWLLKSRALTELYSDMTNLHLQIVICESALCIYTDTVRCKLFVLVSLALFEDVDTSHRVGYRVPLQLCYEKDMMLVTQQIESTYTQTSKVV